MSWRGKTTVVDCFRPGRRRLNTDLVIAVVQALHPDVGVRGAVAPGAAGRSAGRPQAAAQVRVQDSLPQDLAEFTGRTAELDRLRQALRHGAAAGGAVVISAIEGMAGVGKTQLAVHAGHLLAREQPFDRVLFVNLRGFHPDPAQPPADPAAVLDGFLRLLGVPGQQIPHDLDARTAAYRDRLAGTRTLVVLDNAADAEQVRPLLPGTPGLPRRWSPAGAASTDLHPATHLTVDVFTPDEALEFLARAVPERSGRRRPGRRRPGSPRRCGHLPLALGLVAGHIRGHTRLDADRPRRPARRTPPPPAAGHRRGTRPRPVLPAPARRPATTAAAGWRCTPARTSTPTPPPPWPTPTCATAQRPPAPPVPRPPAAAGQPRPVHLPRPGPRLRRRPGRRRGPPARAPRRADPPVRLLPGHRRRRHGHPVPGRGAPPAHASPRRPPRSRPDRPGARPRLAGHRTRQPGRRRRPHRHPRLARPHHPAGPPPCTATSTRRPLQRRPDRPRPRPPRRPPQRRPRCRSPRADQPRRRVLAAGPATSRPPSTTSRPCTLFREVGDRPARPAR